MDTDAVMTDLHTVPVDLGSRSYTIHIGSGLLAQLAKYLEPLLQRQRVFILSDETVWQIYGAALETHLQSENLQPLSHILPAGEATKNWTNLGATLDWLLAEEAGRDDVLIAFGGGVIGDLTGLAAAMMKRGMGFVQIPTTLLAQVDSSVGGKTAINTDHGKNLIGAFYQPNLVLADLDVLKTLPKRQIIAGYAEILKYGLLGDADFFAWLERDGPAVAALEPSALSRAVAHSCHMKAAIVAQDELEGGIRALLNLGHTFGHALEKINGYGPDLLHGEAVGTGMALALRYSAHLGLISDDQAQRGCAVIAAGGLEAEVSRVPGGPYAARALTDAMRQDKKVRGDKVPLILAKNLGQAFIYPDADLSDVEAFLQTELLKPAELEPS